MKLTKYFQKLVLLSLIVAVVGCSDDDDMFLKRDTDHMKFTYLDETKELSVYSNGNWTLTTDEDWIEIGMESGVGSGSDRTMVPITVTHNTGTAKEGTIILSNNANSYEIKVTQEDGVFYFMKNPNEILDNEKPYFTGKLLGGEVSSAFINIPYFKAAPGDMANVKLALSGSGAAGLKVENVEGYELPVGSGVIVIPITGTPENFMGEVIATIDVDVPSRGVQEKLIGKGQVGENKRLESPTVRMYKLLPRLAIVDWGKYTRNSNKPRKFTFELAYTRDGAPIRQYKETNDWAHSNSSGNLTSAFYENNRFALGDLKPGTTYWFRIILHTNNPTEFLDSEMSYFKFETPPEEPLASNVLLYKDFDNFWWGGAPIYQAYGIMPIEPDIKKNLDPSSDDVKATDYRVTFPVNNIANAFAGNLGPDNCPAMWNYYWDGEKYGKPSSANYSGWEGVNAFPCTGGIRLAPATNTGYLKTPKLEQIGEGTANITVTVNSAPYFEAFHSWGEDRPGHLIVVENGGKIVDGGPTQETLMSDTQVAVKSKPNVDPLTNTPTESHAETTTHTIKIEGATKNTRIVIKTHDYVAAPILRGRTWVDDIKIVRD